MKLLKLNFVLLIVIVLSCANLAFATIVDTEHDLSFGNTTWPDGTSYQTNEAQVCVFCHTPHGGSLTGPLWNRNPAAPASWTFYSSATTTDAVNNVAAVNDESMMCLSCHDGSVAISSLLNYGSADSTQLFRIDGGSPGTPFYVVPTPGANRQIGGYQADPGATGHLEDDHPISFNYAAAAGQDSSLEAAPTDGRLRLFSGNLECSTCHNVHDNTTFPPFLVMDNAGSAMCLACHIK